MEYPNSIDEAGLQARRGNLQGALAIIQRFLQEEASCTDPRETGRALIYLGALHRKLGNFVQAREALDRLLADSSIGRGLQAQSWIEVALVHWQTRDLEAGFCALDRAEELLDFGKEPETSLERAEVLLRFHMTFGLLLSASDRPQAALSQYELALDHMNRVRSPYRVTCHMNMANMHAVLGDRCRARSHLGIALETMQEIGLENVECMIQLFETLATFNLFVAGCEQKAIDALMSIPEEVVKDFAAYRRVFDFFSSIIVMAREHRFDLPKLLQLVEEYGNDPLIRAYLPVLVTGCAPPAAESSSPPGDE
jgi:tetratricopeptide (TPR) repeat protein